MHVGARGDLTLRAGEGQGVLSVQGSLRLSGAARFEGVVLVGGDLIVEEGARLVGMERVAGSVRLLSGGRIDGSACAAVRALRPIVTLRAPIPLPDGARIHPL